MAGEPEVFGHPHMPYLLLKAAVVDAGGMLTLTAEALDSSVHEDKLISMEWREDMNSLILTLQTGEEDGI
jgi:hypothetical protein